MRIRAAIVFALVFALTSCSGGASHPQYISPAAPKPAKGAAPWPRPKDPLKLVAKAGLVAARKESFTFHIHVHLDVFVNGKSVPVPSGLGINIKDPGVQHGPVQGGTGYGGIKLCDTPCISPLHTHDFSGAIHVESPEKKTYRLGQLFEEWNVKLNRTCIGGYCAPDARFAIFVDGTRWTGNPDNVPFINLQEIAIVIGSAPKTIPSSSFLNT